MICHRVVCPHSTHFAVSLPRQLPPHQAAQHPPASSLHPVIFTTGNTSPPCPTSHVAHQPQPRHCINPSLPTPCHGTCKFRSLQYVADTPHTAYTFRFALALLQALQLANTPQAPLPTTPCLASPANVFVKPPPMPRHCDTQAHSSPTTDHATASPTATNTHGSPLPRPASPQPSSPHRAAMRAPRAANTNAHAPQTNCSRASPAATDTVPRRPYGNGKFGDGDGDMMGGYGGGRDIR